jgi:hypothetical protein
MSNPSGDAGTSAEVEVFTSCWPPPTATTLCAKLGTS